MSNWASWKKATPSQMANRLKLELSVTPKWKFLKRMSLKRNIKLWNKLDTILTPSKRIVEVEEE